MQFTDYLHPKKEILATGTNPTKRPYSFWKSRPGSVLHCNSSAASRKVRKKHSADMKLWPAQPAASNGESGLASVFPLRTSLYQSRFQRLRSSSAKHMTARFSETWFIGELVCYARRIREKVALSLCVQRRRVEAWSGGTGLLTSSPCHAQVTKPVC